MSHEQYTDDAAISDNAVLWRRITLEQCYREDDGTVRPSSAAFNNHRNGSPMSVALEAVFYKETSKNPYDYLEGHDNVVALTSFTAGLARELKQGITRKPLPDEPAHAEVFGEKPRRIRKAFAKNSLWVIPPPDSLSS